MGLFFFLVAMLGWPVELRVEVRNSEVWVIRDGNGYQLTHDGKSKLQAELSPGKTRIAYYEQCIEAEHCTPTVIILDLEGKPIVSFEPKDLRDPPEVVLQKGLTYSGIHDFVPGMFWAPDSQRIALVDCIYDWKANHPGSLTAGDGEDSNRRCSLAVVSKNGEAALFPLSDLSVDDIRKMSMSWTSPHKLSLSMGNVTKAFTVR